jgi:hypothetical protein
MAIKITYKWLLAPMFENVLRKLAGYTGFPTAKDTYNAAKIVELLDREIGAGRAKSRALADKYAPILRVKEGSTEAAPSAEAVAKAQEEFKAEITALLETNFVDLEKQTQIKIEHLDALKLSPSEMLCFNEAIDFSSIEDKAELAKAITTFSVVQESQQLETPSAT